MLILIKRKEKVTISISGKADFRAIKVIRDKERPNVMIKLSIL